MHTYQSTIMWTNANIYYQLELCQSLLASQLQWSRACEYAGAEHGREILWK